MQLGSTYDEDGYVKFGRIQGDTIVDAHLIKTCINEIVEPRIIVLDQVDENFINTKVKIEKVQFRHDIASHYFCKLSS